MRKKIIISIILCAILFSISIVQAVTGVASLRAKSTSVKPGETFTVTLSVACEDGINGIDTTYSYDKEKLELINANVANNNWASLGSDNSITLISNTTSKITTSDVYVLTFKVKDNAKSGIAKISTNEIMIDSDLAENSSFTVSAKSVNINIVSESHSDDNTEDNNNINDNTENNNNVNDNTENNNNVNDNTENNNNVNDNTENNNNVSDNTENNNNVNDNTENNNNVSNNTEKNNIGNNTSTDNTIIKNSKLPQTGIDSKVSTIVLAIVTVSIAIAIYSFVKIKSIKK